MCPLYNGYGISFPAVNWPECGVENPPHPALRLNEGYSYTSTDEDKNKPTKCTN